MVFSRQMKITLFFVNFKFLRLMIGFGKDFIRAKNTNGKQRNR